MEAADELSKMSDLRELTPREKYSRKGIPHFDVQQHNVNKPTGPSDPSAKSKGASRTI